MLTINPLRKAITSNSTSTGFTAKTPTTTAKTTSAATGVYDLLDPTLGFTHLADHTSRFLQIIPFGTNGENDTFSMRIWGWDKTDDATAVYVPQLLAQFAVVLGSIDGSTAIGVSNTFQADTITLTYGDSTTPIVSPANDLPAHAILHTRGCRYIEFDWDLAGAQEGVSMNAFWRPFDQS